MRHTEVLNVVTRLDVESSDSDPDLCAHLGTVAHCDVVRVGSSPSCNGVLSVYPMTFSVFAVLVEAQPTLFVAAFTQRRYDGYPVAVAFVHGEDQSV